MLHEKALTATLDELKAGLSISYVMDHYGHKPASKTPGRLHYTNPFREDRDPSFDVFVNDQGVQRWGDFPWGKNGSVIDLIELFEQSDLSGALGKARELYASQLEEGYEEDISLKEREISGISEDEWEVLIERGDTALHLHELPNMLVAEKTGLDMDALRGWNLSVWEGRLQVPYPDKKAMRFRFLDGTKTTVPGSRMGLYHKPGLELDLDKPILVVEGETDCWTATAYAPHMQVVSVPGVGHRPEKLGAVLRGAKDVSIFFDGDKAGREGAERWLDGLTELGADCRVVPTPEGLDISDMTKAEFEFFLSQRKHKTVNVFDLIKTENGYAITTAKGDLKYQSDWVLDVLTVLTDDEGISYQGDLRKNGKVIKEDVLLPVSCFHRKGMLQQWSLEHGVTWAGSDVSHQKLANVLSSEAWHAIVLPSTTKPGLVGSTFTYPGGYIGNLEVRTRESSATPLSHPDAFCIEPVTTPEARETLEQLFDMGKPEHMAPLLSWYCAAPLRSKFDHFPIVLLTGKAGSGKTTVARVIQEKFAGVRWTSALTGTTPYGVTSVMDSSNAYPVWFDEYRPGANPDVLKRLDQNIREAWDGTGSLRGGEDKDNLSRTVSRNATAPIIVSGEDFADEDSHRERTIKLFLDTEGQGPLPTGKPLAESYLRFLAYPNQYERAKVEKPPVVRPSEIEGLPSRMAYTIGILDAGYGLLLEYAESVGCDMRKVPAKDWSHVIETMLADSGKDQVIEALLTVFESTFENGRNQAVQIIDGETVIHSSSVIQAVNTLEDARLPFNKAAALSRHCRTNYRAEQRTIHNRRTIVLPFDITEME